MGFARSIYVIPVPSLHKEVERAKRLQKENATEDEKKEAAEYKIPWITTPGTAVVVAALLSAMFCAPRRTCVDILRRTVVQMKIPIPTIACMLGLSYVTKYAGMDATLGVAFAETGVLYPFFAALLGWLGVFTRSTDAGSNALFGSLQKITATEVWTAHHAGAMSNLSLGQANHSLHPANSTGGVMGKMIDAQSICVATAGTNQIGREADIFKAVVWHSILHTFHRRPAHSPAGVRAAVHCDGPAPVKQFTTEDTKITEKIDSNNSSVASVPSVANPLLVK